jgi:uncharacterized protein (DUF58 family)
MSIARTKTADPVFAGDAAANPTRVTLAELVRLKNTVRGIKRPRGGAVMAPLAGGNSARALGRGLDFAEVREYQPGDDVRTIDWKVTARSGRTHTKIYQEERERPFLIAVDLRAGMHFGTRVAFKSVIAARLAAMLAWSAVAQRDRVGGIVFDESGFGEIKPAAGTRGVTRLLNAIVATQARENSAELPLPLRDVFHHLRRTAHTGSSIVLLSDFTGFESDADKAASQLAQHNHVVACHLFDVLEQKLPPPARYTITDGINKGVIDTATQESRAAWERMFAARTVTLRKAFSGRSVAYIDCATSDSLPQVARNILRQLPGSL